ncbi:MAG: OmpA family protein [Flavobacteriaceae bacterium]|nr:OmpA family protein [Flavobacteriaceae bacterium]
MALGIPSTRTALSSKLKEGMVAADSILYGPISFAITKMDDADHEKLQSLFDSITENPLVLYFETGQASISLDSKQRRKVIDIATFLDQVPGSQCTITGHTDNTGERTANVALGLQRAEFAKTYLVGNGIASDKILTASDGPDKPIASNATEEGKALNRRTVVTLKQ